MPSDFAFQELINKTKGFLSPHARGARQTQDVNSAPTESLIISQGVYLHFLRHALGMVNLDEASKQTGFSEGFLSNIEADQMRGGFYNFSAKAFSEHYKKYLNYLVEKLEARVQNPPAEAPARDNALARELLELLKNPKVRVGIQSLPISRTRPHASAVEAGASQESGTSNGRH